MDTIILRHPTVLENKIDLTDQTFPEKSFPLKLNNFISHDIQEEIAYKSETASFKPLFNLSTISNSWKDFIKDLNTSKIKPIFNLHNCWWTMYSSNKSQIFSKGIKWNNNTFFLTMLEKIDNFGFSFRTQIFPRKLHFFEIVL